MTTTQYVGENVVQLSLSVETLLVTISNYKNTLLFYMHKINHDKYMCDLPIDHDDAPDSTMKKKMEEQMVKDQQRLKKIYAAASGICKGIGTINKQGQTADFDALFNSQRMTDLVYAMDNADQSGILTAKLP